MKLDSAIFGTDDPLEYAVKRGIKLFNEDVKTYCLKETALEYCKADTQERRLFLEEKYKRMVLHNKVLPESQTQDIASIEDVDQKPSALEPSTSSKAIDYNKDEKKLITLDSKLSKLMDKPNFSEMIVHWGALNPGEHRLYKM